MKFTADFETTTDENDCRVWGTGIVSIDDNLSFFHGNSIDYFFDFIKYRGGDTFYFHNLKFDGDFILCWLLEHGFKHVKKKKDLKENTFNTLISGMGQFYSITICFGISENKPINVTIIDSLKIIPLSVDAVAKGFNLPISKLKIDYKEFRPKDHVLTDPEISYLRNDCEIMARALHSFFKQGMNKMTQGSNALADYKKIVTKKKFEKWFPIPQYDEDIRFSYKGGFTYCSPKFKGKDVGNGIVLDVNSLYPWVMYNKMLPYGEGINFDGKYKEDKAYPLYCQMMKCQFELKEGHIPTIQVKKNNHFIDTEYLESTEDEEVTLCLTNVDLKLLYDHYEVYNEEWLGGWKFKQTNTLFKSYIDKWYGEKIKAKEEHNDAMYVLSKLMLNALYGKFGLNPKVSSKYPYLGEDGAVHYRKGDTELRDSIYVALASFVTAYAREKTIRSAQTCYDRFMYADTDSLHLIGTEIPIGLDVDDYKLGAWKHESTFIRARFIRQKTYVEDTIKHFKRDVRNRKLKYKYHALQITCAGMPKSCYPNVTWDNFKAGNSFGGKLLPKHVKGGIVLKELKFTIKL